MGGAPGGLINIDIWLRVQGTGSCAAFSAYALQRQEDARRLLCDVLRHAQTTKVPDRAEEPT